MKFIFLVFEFILILFFVRCPRNVGHSAFAMAPPTVWIVKLRNCGFPGPWHPSEPRDGSSFVLQSDGCIRHYVGPWDQFGRVVGILLGGRCVFEKWSFLQTSWNMLWNVSVFPTESIMMLEADVNFQFNDTVGREWIGRFDWLFDFGWLRLCRPKQRCKKETCLFNCQHL